MLSDRFQAARQVCFKNVERNGPLQLRQQSRVGVCIGRRLDLSREYDAVRSTSPQNRPR